MSFMLAAILVFALLISIIPSFGPAGPQETFIEIDAAKDTSIQEPRQISAISYDFPPDLSLAVRSIPMTELLQGKMMLIDKEHPLPSNVPAPNTLSIAGYANGNVPVQSLRLKCGIQAMDALKALFSALSEQEVHDLTVWEGTLSRAEQRVQQVESMHKLMKVMPPELAAQQTCRTHDEPGTGELQQEYTVELRFRTADRLVPDERKLERTSNGQKLLHSAWRYGFIRSNPDAIGREAFRFRYVGKAHATAMTYLDLSLKEYLLWLHQKEVLTIYDGSTPKYLILCQPLQENKAVFTLPLDTPWEASLDNMGYAVVACHLAQANSSGQSYQKSRFQQLATGLGWH